MNSFLLLSSGKRPISFGSAPVLGRSSSGAPKAIPTSRGADGSARCNPGTPSAPDALRPRTGALLWARLEPTEVIYHFSCLGGLGFLKTPQRPFWFKLLLKIMRLRRAG